MWPWRDWVIDAFNRNLPFDHSPSSSSPATCCRPTTRAAVATGFNRNHCRARKAASSRRSTASSTSPTASNTFGAAFLGLTLGCARCHDHKYDPVTQRDYSLFAFFNSVNETGQIPYSGMPSPTVTADGRRPMPTRGAARGHAARSSKRWRVDAPRHEAAFEAGCEAGAAVAAAAVPRRIVHLPLDADRRRSVDSGPSRADRPRVGGADEPAGDDGARARGRCPEARQRAAARRRQPRSTSAAGRSSSAFFERNEPFSFALWLRPRQERRRRAVVMHAIGRVTNGNRGSSSSCGSTARSRRP